MPAALFNGLDHFAIAVPDTEEALKVWRDKFGFALLYSEDVNNATVRLTHLDLGNTHLQLVQPLTLGSSFASLAEGAWRRLAPCVLASGRRGRGAAAAASYQIPTAGVAHQGTRGKRALFLNKVETLGVQVEVTGA